MNKPEKKTIEYYDYYECEEFLREKLGYDLEDTLGKYTKAKKEVEYRNFWHFLLDNCWVENESFFTFQEIEEYEEVEDWQKVILLEFIEEFGYGPYWTEW
jgi:hypothetical protein